MFVCDNNSLQLVFFVLLKLKACRFYLLVVGKRVNAINVKPISDRFFVCLCITY